MSPSSSSSYDEYDSKLKASALSATKQGFLLPQDLQFHRTLDKSFSNELDVVSSRIFSLTDKLLRYAKGFKGKGKAVIKNEDDLLDGYHLSVVDTIDQLYENADKFLDEFLARTTPKPIEVTMQPLRQTVPKKYDRLDPKLLNASHLEKPQLKFRRPVDNTRNSDLHHLRKKWHASVPLEYIPTQSDIDLMELNDPNSPSSTHPYLYETFHIPYSNRLFIEAEPIRPKSYDDTPFSWADTPESLELLLVELRKAKEIAVDLEYHSMRSYYGFVCLMQISTREQDWVIDTLELRDELEALNEVFTDPGTIKVFHGAESDIIWLQQDFNIYVVNLFDTYHASVLLGGFPKNGLASLLQHFCDFEADKRYQLADWRIRPLPEEMLFYARSDTHFLLFVYDSVRNLLLQRTPGSEESVRRVLALSNRTALQKYTPEVYDVVNGYGPNGWRNFLSKFNIAEGQPDANRRKAVVIAVHAWRDSIARETDEGTRYVLPSNMIFRLANAPPPKDLASLISILSPMPPVIRERAQELLDVVHNAKLPDTITLTQEPSVEIIQREDTLPTFPGDTIHFSESILPDLWSRSSVTRNTPCVIEASISSLFGEAGGSVMVSDSAMLNPVAASSSTLFGPKTSTRILGSQRMTKGGFNSVLRRVHSSLVVIPATSSLLPATNLEPGRKSEVVHVDHTILKMPAEVGYVPAAERTTLSVARTTEDPLTGDTIVVVGRKKDKKKNKNAQRLTSTSADIPPVVGNTIHLVNEANGSSEADGTMQFDYASVPNILDDDDDVKAASGSNKRGKKHQKTGDKAKRTKGPAVQYGDFPAPPRNRAEPRSGNVSRSFK